MFRSLCVIPGLCEIPSLGSNLFFGALGALLLVLYRVYRMFPEIKATKPPVSGQQPTQKQIPPIKHLVWRAVLSVVLGSLVTGLILRPQESHGAMIVGMMWTELIRHHSK